MMQRALFREPETAIPPPPPTVKEILAKRKPMRALKPNQMPKVIKAPKAKNAQAIADGPSSLWKTAIKNHCGCGKRLKRDFTNVAKHIVAKKCIPDDQLPAGLLTKVQLYRKKPYVCRNHGCTFATMYTNSLKRHSWACKHQDDNDDVRRDGELPANAKPLPRVHVGPKNQDSGQCGD